MIVVYYSSHLTFIKHNKKLLFTVKLFLLLFKKKYFKK